jgi:hypothetical protein
MKILICCNELGAKAKEQLKEVFGDMKIYDLPMVSGNLHAFTDLNKDGPIIFIASMTQRVDDGCNDYEMKHYYAIKRFIVISGGGKFVSHQISYSDHHRGYVPGVEMPEHVPGIIEEFATKDYIKLFAPFV